MDCSDCRDDKRWTCILCVFLRCSLVSWISRKHKVVSRPSTQFEVHIFALIVSYILWIKNFLNDLVVFLTSVSYVYCDNMAIECLAKHHVLYYRIKQIEMDFHFIYKKSFKRWIILNLKSNLQKIWSSR